MIVLRDKQGDRIGDVVGWLGWIANKLSPNQVTMLGYPANLDSGLKMHQVNAGRHKAGGVGTVVYGSDMRGGSSGGPWVQNFGIAATGQEGGNNNADNRVVGITSYNPTATAPKTLGSSTPGSVFVSLFQMACDQSSRNCD